MQATTLVLILMSSTLLAAQNRPLTVWLIPSEEAEARAGSDSNDITQEIQQFNQTLKDGPVRVLNTVPPLDQQLIVWNSAFAVPNWAWVKNQTETIRALQRFATLHKTRINVRFVTWDKAFASLTLPRTPDENNPPPDVVQIGTTWAAYFASKGLIVSRPHNGLRVGAWQPVMGIPSAALPYINDTRLLFYWKRLPRQDLSAPPLVLDTSSWKSVLDSLRNQGGPEDRLAFAGGLTLNLLYDYSMLVWAGGGDSITSTNWRVHADLTSENALRVPRLLAEAATEKNGRRLLAVPESSHQELTKAFAAGEYRGTIEPAAFISRWKKDFDKTFKGAKRFWDYAAAAVLPQPFHGGSYLTVMPSPDLSPIAFDLAEFLATDDEYTTVLARNGHLPALRAGYGMDVLLDWLGGSADEAKQFTNLVQQATIQGRSLPDLPNWPTAIESTEVQEAMQRVWRRIGEGNLKSLNIEAHVAEDTLNLKIDRVTQLRHFLAQFWWLGATMAFCVVAIFGVQKQRSLTRVRVALAQVEAALEREEIALDQIQKLRGFSAMALLALARYHTSLRAYEPVSDGLADAKKRSIIAAGINGWRRGRNLENWKPSPIHESIWRAVLLGFDVVIEPDVFEKWETQSKHKPQHPRKFLEDLGILRKSSVGDELESPYFIDVLGEEDILVQMPFLFEQALACLLQNAIQASDRECNGRGPRKPILISVDSLRVTVRNAGDPFPCAIRELINDCTIPEEFENGVLAAVRSKGGPKPGIGLTEAYTIARQYYGGLLIAEGPPSISICLKAEAKVQ
jgi:hypothetical protein